MQEFEITLETAPGKTELVLIPEQTKLEQIAKRYQKNYRDRIMIALHKEFPEYGWATNMGYATKQHQEALNKYGLPWHEVFDGDLEL